MKANQILSQGSNKYLFKVKMENNTQLHLSTVFMKRKTLGLICPLVPWRREARYNPQKHSALAITAYVPEGLRVVARVRFDVLCLSPVLFDKGKCHRESSFLWLDEHMA